MPAEQASVAIVLRARDYSEADRIVTLLTRDFGKLSGIARGAKASRRRKEPAIEAKGCVGVGDIELTEKVRSRACNSRDRYWLYVVYHHCGTLNPRLFRVQDLFRKLIATANGRVIIDETELFRAAEDGLP